MVAKYIGYSVKKILTGIASFASGILLLAGIFAAGMPAFFLFFGSMCFALLAAGLELYQFATTSDVSIPDEKIVTEMVWGAVGVGISLLLALMVVAVGVDTETAAFFLVALFNTFASLLAKIGKYLIKRKFAL